MRTDRRQSQFAFERKARTQHQPTQNPAVGSVHRIPRVTNSRAVARNGKSFWFFPSEPLPCTVRTQTRPRLQSVLYHAFPWEGALTVEIVSPPLRQRDDILTSNRASRPSKKGASAIWSSASVRASKFHPLSTLRALGHGFVESSCSDGGLCCQPDGGSLPAC